MISLLEIFLEVAKTKNFSQAAENLSVSKSNVSKKIAELEESLNCELFLRNTRKVNLTPLGLQLYEKSLGIFSQLTEVIEEIKSEKKEPSGLLKILAPHEFSAFFLAKIIPDFQQIFPKISFYFQLDSKIEDFIHSGFDLAFRDTRPNDQDLVSKKIISIKPILCGTNTYFKSRGKPAKIQDLTHHNICMYSKNFYTEKTIIFTKNGTETILNVKGNFYANTLSLIKAQLISGNSLAILFDFSIQEEIKKGTVEVLFPDYAIPSSNIYAVYSRKKSTPLKIQAFLRFLADEIVKITPPQNSLDSKESLI